MKYQPDTGNQLPFHSAAVSLKRKCQEQDHRFGRDFQGNLPEFQHNFLSQLWPQNRTRLTENKREWNTSWTSLLESKLWVRGWGEQRSARVSESSKAVPEAYQKIALPRTAATHTTPRRMLHRFPLRISPLLAQARHWPKAARSTGKSRTREAESFQKLGGTSFLLTGISSRIGSSWSYRSCYSAHHVRRLAGLFDLSVRDWDGGRGGLIAGISKSITGISSPWDGYVRRVSTRAVVLSGLAVTLCVGALIKMQYKDQILCGYFGYTTKAMILPEFGWIYSRVVIARFLNTAALHRV